VRSLPFVIVYLWKGRSEEVKERIIKGITKVLSDEGVAESSVSVVIEEVPKENWGIGGQPASKKSRQG